MGAITFIHAADLHIDRPFQNSKNFNHVWHRRLRNSTWDALDNLIELAIKEAVDFVIISGDIFHLESYSYKAKIEFYKRISRLASHKIHSYIIYGNHDPAIDYEDKYCTFVNDEYIHMFSDQEIEKISYYKNDREVAKIYGRSFSQQENSSDPSLPFIKAAKEDEENLLKIALVHGRVGERSEYPYCNSCSLQEMSASSIHYWAMGHVHTRKYYRYSMPYIVYPGNIQGMNMDELGAKGCYLVKWEDNQIADIRFQALEAIRWEQISVSIDSIDHSHFTITKVIKQIKLEIEKRYIEIKKPLIVQLILKGSTVYYSHLQEQSMMKFLKGKLMNDFYIVTEIVNQTIPLIDTNKEEYNNPFIEDYKINIQEARHSEEIFNMLQEELQSLFSNEKFQTLTQTKAHQRGKGQWKLKKVKQDIRSWLSEAEKYGIRLLYSHNSGRMKTQPINVIQKLIQQLTQQKQSLFYNATLQSTISKLLEDMDEIEQELELYRNKQQEYQHASIQIQRIESGLTPQNQNPSESYEIMIELVSQACKDNSVPECNQHLSELDSALFLAVKRWTILTMALWALNRLKDKNHLLIFDKAGNTFRDSLYITG